IDHFPPTPRDPRGLHSALWEELGGDPFQAPEGEPLMVASYFAARPPVAFLEPVAVGRPLPNMDLFLAPDLLVKVPLEATYARACAGVPFPSRNALESPTWRGSSPKMPTDQPHPSRSSGPRRPQLPAGCVLVFLAGSIGLFLGALTAPRDIPPNFRIVIAVE